MAAGAIVGSTAAATYLAVAGRELREHGRVDRRRARIRRTSSAPETLLPSLVGRDVAHLDARGMARAVVESVAENTVDAVVAPAWWAALAGAPGALGYRAVNTMDSMVGHRNDRYLALRLGQCPPRRRRRLRPGPD